MLNVKCHVYCWKLSVFLTALLAICNDWTNLSHLIAGDLVSVRCNQRKVGRMTISYLQLSHWHIQGQTAFVRCTEERLLAMTAGTSTLHLGLTFDVNLQWRVVSAEARSQRWVGNQRGRLFSEPPTQQGCVTCRRHTHTALTLFSLLNSGVPVSVSLRHTGNQEWYQCIEYIIVALICLLDRSNETCEWQITTASC